LWENEIEMSDHTLVARALALKVARWEPFSGSSTTGELCFGGIRYGSNLDEFGVPVLDEVSRERLVAALDAYIEME
jgi:hypothetical protein